MPCFPSKKDKIIRPQDTGVPYKNVHRYGETNVRHVSAPLKQEHWKKSQKTNPSGQSVPHHREAPAQHLQRKPPPTPQRPIIEETQSEVNSYTRTRPIQADFFVSVPIFTETLDHSYRKRNEFVYKRHDEEGSVTHQTLSRASSLRSLNNSGTLNPQSARSTGQQPKSLRKRRPKSLPRYDNQAESRPRRRQMSGSEASFNTSSTSYSYETERFEAANKMRSVPRHYGLQIDSDEEDER